MSSGTFVCAVNDRLVVDAAAAPTSTILDYLRTKLGRTDAKEGCASGDCGACTVLIGEPETGEYRATLSCIAPLGVAQGKHVVTAGGLVHNGELHPVQRALVAHHGSQCGFCTPGFVMALAGLYAANPAPTRDDVIEALSGNLCRCTGYRPIVAAGLAMQSFGTAAGLIDMCPSRERLATARTSCLEHGAERYFQPATEAELRSVVGATTDYRLIAGGTDLMLEHTLGLKTLPCLVDVSRVEELRRIESTPDGWQLGAAVTYVELEAFFSQHKPELVPLLKRIGSRQIRASGTLGGNLANASPVADLPPVLLALDATVELHDAAGGVRTVPLERFYLSYKRTVLERTEWIANVRVPRAALAGKLVVFKVAKRYEDDISSVLGAVRLDANGGRVDAARVAFGGMAAVPKRAPATEAALAGNMLGGVSRFRGTTTIREDFDPIDDVRASAAYRAEVAANLVLKAWRGDTAHTDVFAGG